MMALPNFKRILADRWFSWQGMKHISYIVAPKYMHGNREKKCHALLLYNLLVIFDLSA